MVKVVNDTGAQRMAKNIKSLLGGKVGYKSTMITPLAQGAAVGYTLAVNSYGGDITQILFKAPSSATAGIVAVTNVTDKMKVGERLVLVNPTNIRIAVSGISVYGNGAWSEKSITLHPGYQLTIMKTSDRLIALRDVTIE